VNKQQAVILQQKRRFQDCCTIAAVVCDGSWSRCSCLSGVGNPVQKDEGIFEHDSSRIVSVSCSNLVDLQET